MKTKQINWMLALLMVVMLASCGPAYVSTGYNYGYRQPYYGYGYSPYRYGYGYRPPVVVSPPPRVYYNRPYNYRPYTNPGNPGGRFNYGGGGNHHSRGPR